MKCKIIVGTAHWEGCFERVRGVSISLSPSTRRRRKGRRREWLSTIPIRAQPFRFISMIRSCAWQEHGLRETVDIISLYDRMHESAAARECGSTFSPSHLVESGPELVANLHQSSALILKSRDLLNGLLEPPLQNSTQRR